MNVNAWATLALARQLLPGTMEKQFGRFVSISSNIAVYGRGADPLPPTAQLINCFNRSGRLFMP